MNTYLDWKQTDPGSKKPNITLLVNFQAEHEHKVGNFVPGIGAANTREAVSKMSRMESRFLFRCWLSGETTKPLHLPEELNPSMY